MYRVFLVDDRVDVVEGIMALVPWESLGCVAVGSATNGRDAYERIDAKQPDIIITDIKMPVMDGLQLIELCKEQKQQIRFIVLSGYDDFAFAQKAVRLGVDEYILKPAGVEEISETLKRIVESLDEEREKDASVRSLRRQLNQSLPLLRDEYFRFLVSAGRPAGREEAAERFGFLNIAIATEQLVLALLTPFTEEGEAAASVYRQRETAEAAKGILTAYYQCESFCYGADEVALLLQGGNQGPVSERHLRLSFEELGERLQRERGIRLCAGISQEMEDITGIGKAFIQARQALSYGMYRGGSPVVFWNEIAAGPVQDRVDYMDIEDRLVHAVRISDTEEIGRLIGLFFDSNQNVAPQQMKSAVREITTIVSHYALAGEGLGAARTAEEWQETFKRLHTAGDLKAWMIRLFNDISRTLSDNQGGQLAQYVENVKYVVENNYANNISLAAVSELIGLTPPYLSALFKERTGQTFTEYLVSVRIRKAKELLRTGSFKIYEVAEQVGYADVRYFGEIFKKKTGLTPKEFMTKETKA